MVLAHWLAEPFKRLKALQLYNMGKVAHSTRCKEKRNRVLDAVEADWPPLKICRL